MEGVINLTILQIVAAYIFVVILLFVVKSRGISREKEILIASVRMTLQLILTGYVLVYLFDKPSPVSTIAVMALMEIFAVYTIFKRSKLPLSSDLKIIITFSMIVGTLATILYFLLVVINITPWYDPQYCIPIAGMVVGNSMTGISLGISRLVGGMNEQKNIVESALMLGATPKKATKEIVDNAFDSAIIPTINSMLGMGIVFLPGMMTGQILSGTSPMIAIKYQIAIMLGIMGSVALTVILLVQLGYKTFFNDESQLIIND